MRQWIAKRLKNIAFALLLGAGILMVPSNKAYAYDESKTTVDEEGQWEVNNADGPTVSVSMYMMMQPEYADSTGFRWYYNFDCLDGEFYFTDGRTDTSSPMIYYFRAENADVIDTYKDYEIWHWAFRLEPGTYTFCEPDSNNKQISLLTSSLGSSRYHDGYQEPEEIVVNDGDEIVLFSMFGDWEWRKSDDVVEDLMDYAKQRSEQLSYGHPTLQTTDADETTTISVEGEGEPNKEEVLMEEEETQLSEEVQSSEEAQPSEEEQDSPVNEEAEPSEETESTGNRIIPVAVILLVVVLALTCILCYIIKIKKEDR